MYNAQLGLIEHIKQSGTDIKTCEPYSGQLKDAVKLTTMLPAVLPFLQPSNPSGMNPKFNFDVFVITKSESFDKMNNINNNLQLVSKLSEYFEKQPDFNFKNTDYLIDADSMQAKPYLLDNKFCIVYLSVEIKRDLI